MCRLVGYLGPPVTLASLIYEPPRSLEFQSYRPREQTSGYVNVDGTGVAWWDGESSEPLRYITERPPWADPNLPALSRRLRGGTVLAAVRSATPGVPFGPANVAPFVHGGMASVHNGYLRAFREKTARPLLERLPNHLFGALDAMSDSQLLFLTVLRNLEQDPSSGLAVAVRGAVIEAAEVCAKESVAASLNLVVAEAGRMVATRAAEATVSSSLYTLVDGARWPNATLIASEPLDDDPLWAAVPDGHLVEVTSAGIRTMPLKDTGTPR